MRLLKMSKWIVGDLNALLKEHHHLFLMKADEFSSLIDRCVSGELTKMVKDLLPSCWMENIIK